MAIPVISRCHPNRHQYIRGHPLELTVIIIPQEQRAAADKYIGAGGKMPLQQIHEQVDLLIVPVTVSQTPSSDWVDEFEGGRRMGRIAGYSWRWSV